MLVQAELHSNRQAGKFAGLPVAIAQEALEWAPTKLLDGPAAIRRYLPMTYGQMQEPAVDLPLQARSANSGIFDIAQSSLLIE
jgi:hypothetical protein